MADLPRRRAERRLSTRTAVLVALLAFAGPGTVRAQQPAAASASHTSLEVEGSFRLSRIRGETARMAGGAALLRVGRRFAFGLGGWTVIPELSIRRPGGSLDFSLSYGGAVGQVDLMKTAAATYSARVLVGAGTGKLGLPVVGTEIEADNFGVVEPELAAAVDLGGPLHVSAAFGYRTVFGVQDLPGVEDASLRGWTARLSLGLRIF